jgi:hypothetical protein
MDVLTGYPGKPSEVDWFVQMMKNAAPKISDDDSKKIEEDLDPRFRLTRQLAS